MKLRSLSDLEELLPDSERHQRPISKTPQRHMHNGKGKVVCVSLDKKGRKGKSVTLVAGLQHNSVTMEDIARILKRHCGAGGTVKEGNIEIQGDQRLRVTAKLREMNYVIK